jgi:Flp pilus assembly secretin CpaC
MSRKPARRILQQASCAVLFVIAVLLAGPARGNDTVSVILDRATILKLPEKISSVIVGNPLIADVSLQPGGIMVLTGKGFGATNILALDRGGTVLMEKSVQVVGPRNDVLVVYRGAAQESYSCSPHCERRITLGDDKGHFEAAIGQTETRVKSAQGITPGR